MSDRTTRVFSEKTKLCSRCFKRQGSTKKIARKVTLDPKNCEICRGLLLNLRKFARNVIERLNEYQFDTFLIGGSIPQEILNTEDEIRSRLKIRGKESIKTEITRTIAGEVSKHTGRKVSFSVPDVTAIISLPDGIVSILPRSIWISARYLKASRGLSQRSSICEVCNGIGCATCVYKGTSGASIQSILESFFCKKFRAEGCSFIWIGSEDNNSLVNGDGRPIYVEILKPKKRKIRLSKKVDFGTIKLASIRTLASKPTIVPQFMIKCLAYLIQKQIEKVEHFEAIKSQIESKFKDLSVRVRLSRRKSRVVTKKIQSITVNKDMRNHPLVLEIKCDGGIPIRKLISGEDGSVEPNLSPYLHDFELDPAMPFDIEEIFVVSPQNSKLRKVKNEASTNPVEKTIELEYGLGLIAEETA
jgi:tRNA pseudouridine synthase 10